MTPSRTKRAFIGSTVALPALLGTLLVGAPSATAGPSPAPPEAQPGQVRVVTYDASQAGEFKAEVEQSAKIWNDSVHDVRLVPGSPAAVTIRADDGWPRTQTDRLGSGKVWIGRQAVHQGYDMPRITAHELGHILGLTDRRTGNCDELMSGHSAPPDCRNARPNQQEIADVEQNFAKGAVIPQQLFVDSVPENASR